jgi:hypothetical protein
LWLIRLLNSGPSDLPPFEVFLADAPANAEEAKFFQDVRVGNTLIVEVRSVENIGVTARALCTESGPKRDLESLELDIFVPMIYLAADFQSTYQRKQLLRGFDSTMNSKAFKSTFIAYVFAVSSDNRTLNLRLEESNDFSCVQKLVRNAVFCVRFTCGHY